MNAICYSPAEIGNCPITDIQFAAGDTAEYAEYTKLEYGGMSLVYTKTAVDQGPIMATHVGSKPCINKERYSKEETDGLYYLEQRRDVCEKYDDRYEKLSDFKVNEYDV